MKFTDKERNYLKFKKIGKHPKTERDSWDDLKSKWIEWMKKVNKRGEFRDFIVNKDGDVEFYDIYN